MKSSDFALNILKGEIASFLDHLPIVWNRLISTTIRIELYLLCWILSVFITLWLNRIIKLRTQQGKVWRNDSKIVWHPIIFCIEHVHFSSVSTIFRSGCSTNSTLKFRQLFLIDCVRCVANPSVLSKQCEKDIGKKIQWSFLNEHKERGKD
jgi:hypothetical protein